MKPKKPLNKFWNRSSFFYKIRYALLLKNTNTDKLPKFNYNKYNEINSIPKLYFEINKEIFKNYSSPKTDFDKALHIAIWLRKNIKGGKGLGVSSEKALKYMLSGGYGICSDFCQIFNNFCVINGIKVREWGLLNQEVEKDGHSFNEFYASELKQWVLIDISYVVYFTSKTINENFKILSAREVFNYSSLDKKKEMVFYIKDYKPNIKILKKYYYGKNIQPFIVDKYRNKFYDNLLKKLDFLPIPFIHGIAILLNKSYVYRKIPLSSKSND